MNDRSFVKLFSSIVTSSLWNEDSDSRVVWITMLALANSHGQIISTVSALSRIANVPPETCQKAINTFCSPDQDSRTKTDEGRRLRVIDGGWELVNYELYKQMMSEEDRKDYQRKYQQKHRTNKNHHLSNSSSFVINPTQGEGEREAEAEAEEGEGANESQPTLGLETDQEFFSGLVKNSAYSGMDVPREHAKMVNWCKVNHKNPSSGVFNTA